jgi:hypothetical protein
MIPSKKTTLALLIGMGLLMSACSGLKGGTTGTGTGTGTTYTVTGSITGLTGTGLQLLDTINGTTADTITIKAAATTLTFDKAVPSGETYAVTVAVQPTSPAQTCTVTSGTGTASANVTNVAVACTTNPVTATIGGTVSNLATGSSLVLQDNGGDSLTITTNGAFTFKTPVTGPTDAYAVTVLTQPASPTQICTVTNGSGTASANVTNVAVSCVLSYTIGGTVTGLVGTGLILENSSDSEQLTISPATGNEAFTFKNLVPTGTAYTVSIATQPTGPVQTCVVSPGTGSGTATSNVTSVLITCPAVTYSVGGTVVGLKGVSQPSSTPPIVNGVLTDNSFSLQDNLGNTQVITENGPFTFATPVALNDAYNISVFTLPSTQPQGCTTWDYKGVVTANVTNIVIDCAHNDWTWIGGTNVAGVAVPPAPQYGSFPTAAPTLVPNPYTNTPGARYSAAGWTDAYGDLWLFGGNGWELAGNPAPDTLNAPMNDLWVCVMSGDQCQWQLVGGYDPTVVGTTTVGAEIIANAQDEYQEGAYGPSGYPGARWGAATWTDTAGNLWLFGGNGLAYNASVPAQGLLSDLWEYNTTGLNPGNLAGATAIGQWVLKSGPSSNQVNQPGTYTGTEVPGGRVSPVFWTDATGNFWLFGGYGFDANGNEGFLNDLWEYTAGAWVFIGGGSTINQVGNYGTPGTPASSNIPGGRQEAVGWADASGNLWLFGGEGEDSLGTAGGILNDLWVYNILNNQWTFVLGSTTANQTGVYETSPAVGPVSTIGAAGTCGLTVGDVPLTCGAISTTGALPGSRWGASAWVDAGGNFWLFGGWGLDSTATNGNGALNDTWVYTPNSTAVNPGTWVWVKGSNTGSQNGIYGDETRPYKTYELWTPGGRSNATHWVDGNGQLWLFGGEGYDSTSTNGNGYLNDLWRYLPYPD